MGVWIRSQWDKTLMSLFVVGFCGLAFACLWFGRDHPEIWDKLTAFALQAASGCLGCLLTLVTARRGADQPLFPPDPTSSTTTAQVTTVSRTDPPTPTPVTTVLGLQQPKPAEPAPPASVPQP